MAMAPPAGSLPATGRSRVQACAAVTDAPGATPGDAAAAAAAPMIDDAAGVAGIRALHELLGRWRRMDKLQHFLHPVTEAQAPGYHTFVTHPMSFDRMQEKVVANEYHTWRGFLADLELIFANAQHFNRPAHPVHKAAVELQTRCRKFLDERDGAALEKAAREGFARRHPGGLAAAAEEEAAQRRAAAAAAAEAAISAAATPRARNNGRPPPAKPCVQGGPLVGSLGGNSATPMLTTPVGPFGGALGATLLGPSLLARQSGGAAAAELPGAPAAARTCSFAEAALVAADDMQLDLHSDAGEGYSSFSDSDGEAAGERALGPGSGSGAGGSCIQRLGAAVEVRSWDARVSADAEGVAGGASRTELTVPVLLEHAFFAAMAGLRTTRQEVSQAVPGGLEGEDAKGFPARAHAALELCERHLAALRSQLAQPRLVAGPGRPPKRAAAPQKRAGGGRGRGRGGRSLLGLHSERSKRGRRDLDLADMVAPALGGSGGPRFVERVQSQPIATPQVRPLAERELAARRAIIARLRASTPDGAGNSSSEDTDDEAFTARHDPEETAEYVRNRVHKDGKVQRRTGSVRGVPKAVRQAIAALPDMARTPAARDAAGNSAALMPPPPPQPQPVPAAAGEAQAPMAGTPAVVVAPTTPNSGGPAMAAAAVGAAAAAAPLQFKGAPLRIPPTAASPSPPAVGPTAALANGAPDGLADGTTSGSKPVDAAPSSPPTSPPARLARGRSGGGGRGGGRRNGERPPSASGGDPMPRKKRGRPPGTTNRKRDRTNAVAGPGRGHKAPSAGARAAAAPAGGSGCCSDPCQGLAAQRRRLRGSSGDEAGGGDADRQANGVVPRAVLGGAV
ncbi:hypothetical protein WJX81_002507 [Elliptochloris bilobata]|uniref:Bromo domain-containing protein n=1 Tax=Elliptochloris bilobata TaxID=381761 RepID=A0AAW1SIR6_9CHLO